MAYGQAVSILLTSALLPSRIQMAFTLGYHVLLVPLGVALPTLTLLMEAIGLLRRDESAFKLARRWSVVMAVQFAVGAVTGTILSFEFGILWPKMLGRFGSAFGLGFAIEGWAFFHFLLGLVLPPAGLLGAFGVLAANAWMNTPGGVTAMRTLALGVMQAQKPALVRAMLGPTAVLLVAATMLLTPGCGLAALAPHLAWYRSLAAAVAALVLAWGVA